jgi:ABC-2 type transport system ATP-binding protein
MLADRLCGRHHAPMAAVEVADLHVQYGDVEAVRGVAFSVAEGEVFGLLGPNGAGKTSTLEVCEGYRAPSSGRVQVLGRDPADRTLRQTVGVVLQDIAVTPFLSVREVVTRNAAYYDHPRGVEDVVALVGLQDKAAARVNTLSGGQQRRLDLALGIIGRPTLLFLDEPTTGFDPSARRGAWEVIRALRDEGTTIVLTTHYLEEAEALADRVCVLAAGRVLAEGPPAALSGRDDAPATVRFGLPDGPLPPVAPGDVVTRNGDLIAVATTDAVRTLHVLTGWSLERGTPLAGLIVERPSLEDVYLQLTAGAA